MFEDKIGVDKAYESVAGQTAEYKCELRAKALDLALAHYGDGGDDLDVTKCAKLFYDFLLDGTVPEDE